jgi:hypothetical protein
VGKDPGHSPLSLLQMLRRRGRVQPAELERLDLTAPMDVKQIKAGWIAALQQADEFVRGRPPGEAGCLYFSRKEKRFVNPNSVPPEDVAPHFGRPGGVLPRLLED